MPGPIESTHVIGNVTIKVVASPEAIASSDSPKGKSFLLLQFPDGREYAITTNLAEMIGGAGAGVRKRREDIDAARSGLN